MQKIGLTGNIGSGKTTVCRIFETLGVPVFYADIEAKKILNSPEIIKKLQGLFGNDVIDSDGKPNRGKIAGIVFNNKDKLDKLNAIIHPAVIDSYNSWTAKHRDFPYTIKEAAILFESGYDSAIDKVIVVASDEKLMIQRVAKRDNVNKSEVLSRLENQMSQDEKVKRADFVIYNDEREMILPQILDIHKFLSNK